MPSLVWAGRQWPIADDDLVPFGLIGVMTCIPYLCILAHVVSAADGALPPLCAIAVRHFVAGAFSLGAVSLVVYVAIMRASGSGEVWQMSPRTAVPRLLWIQVVLLLAETVWLSVGLAAGPAVAGGSCEGVPERAGPLRELGYTSVVWIFINAIPQPLNLVLLFSLSQSLGRDSLVARSEWWRRRCAAVFGCCVRDRDSDVFASIADVLAQLLHAHGAERATVSDILVSLLLARDSQQRELAAARMRESSGSGTVDTSPPLATLGPGAGPEGRWRSLRRLVRAAAPLLRKYRAHPPKAYAYGETVPLGQGAVDLLHNVSRLARYACAAYGWPVALWMGHTRAVQDTFCCSCPGPCGVCCCRNSGRQVSPRRRSEAAFVRVAGVEPTDVLATDWRLSSRPLGACAYAVVVDQGAGEVVVAVRGTLSAADLLTDVACECVAALDVRDALRGAARTMDGSSADASAPAAAADLPETDVDDPAAWDTHKGILLSARELVNHLESRHVLSNLRRSMQPGGLLREYRLVFTGHSLGAAVASLAAILVRARGLPHARAVAFSPPPLLPALAAAECSSVVTSVVMEGDVVPRLSYRSVSDLAAEMIEELRRCRAPKWLVLGRALKGSLANCWGQPSDQAAADRRFLRRPPLGSARGVSEHAEHEPAPSPASPPAAERPLASLPTLLCVLGRVMLLERDDSEPPAPYLRLSPCCGDTGQRYEAKWVSSSAFAQLKVFHNMIDHLPDKMLAVLDSLARASTTDTARTGFESPV